MAETLYFASAPERPALLCWLDKGGGIRECMLDEVRTMGRAMPGATADICVASDFVSARHGSFTPMGGKCLYQDESSNGTWLNGKLLGKKSTQNQMILTDGDILRIGSMDDAHMAQSVVLIYRTRYEPGSQWQVYKPTTDVAAIELGRKPMRNTNSLVLQDQTVSERHCKLMVTMDGWGVENLSKTNPVQVNGKTVAGCQGLRAMDVLRCGNDYIIFDGTQFYMCIPPEKTSEVQGSTPRPEETLSINIIRRSVKKWRGKVDLLRDVHLTINGGEMALILGGSGAGKTTFLNAVMGYEQAEGTIRFGEVDVYQDFEEIKYNIGFVPQEDLLRPNDLVDETLDNAARMKMPSSVSESARRERVQDILVLFGLEHERDKLVCKLSGGQRKRLSIAVEYIGNPGLFFLDEPDSGLDGVMARALMENLRFIADSGKIVMVISHGPDRVRDLLDKVIVLAKSTKDDCGHLAFYGSPEQALEFFDATSLEGVVRRINREDEGGDGMADYYIDKYEAEGRTNG